MLRPSVPNILLFWFVKYIGFYLFLMPKNNNYAFIRVDEINTCEGWGYYLFLFLSLPVLCFIVFSIPMCFLFKTKTPLTFTIIATFVLIIEYSLYTWLASTSDLMNGIYNGIISVLFILIFFFRHIRALYK